MNGGDASDEFFDLTTSWSRRTPRTAAWRSSPSRSATSILVHFDCGQGMSLVAKVGPSTPIQPGSTLSFQFAPEYCHLFAREDGARLY